MGISDKAIKTGYAENKFKYNKGSELQNKEFSDGSGLDLYDAVHRMYDPQLGRFGQIDAYTDFTPNNSGYAFVGNNPLLFNDPLGLDTVRVEGDGAHKIQIARGDILAYTIGNATSYYKYDPDSKDAVGGFVGEGIASGTEEAVTVTPTSEQTQKKTESSDATGKLLAAVGIGLSVGDHEMYNAKTWYSLRTWTRYSQRFNGNQITGGKNALAGNVSKGFKVAGWALGITNAILIMNNKEMSGTQKWIEQGSNAFGTVGGIYGAAWSLGWEGGRAISNNDWYRENVRPLIQDALGIQRDEFPRLPYDIDALNLGQNK
jgi:RHS repeat-associated protein